MTDWRKALLHAIGAPVTASNLRFLSSWQRWEGGHTNNNARFNWLNTTHGPGRSINSVGVKAFDSFQTGIKSLAETLMNGRYDDVVSGLAKGNPYKYNVTAGLETWVSGSPTGNPGYARKVLGGAGGSVPAPAVGGGRPPAMAFAPSAPSSDPLQQELVRSIFGGGQLGDLAENVLAPPVAMPNFPAPTLGNAPSNPRMLGGKGILLPTHWAGTHVTDGLGWGTKTAEDIMGAPGTPVRMPVGGTVVYFHPTGAQGGGSMLIRTTDGREYWLGHIANGMKAGTRFRAGATVAVISGDHPRPHVHVDARSTR